MKLAVSSCLLGNKVRYDGGHKYDHFIIEQLGKYFELIPFCPEDIAYGTPRPAIRLFAATQDTLTIQTSNAPHIEKTAPLLQAIEREAEKIESSDICGVIFKAKSPTCALGSTKVYHPDKHIEGRQDGLFAAHLKERFPLLPKEEEARLQDDWLKENFIMAIFVVKELKELYRSQPAYSDLVAFHTAYKYLLHAKDEKRYRQMGQVVANHEKKSLEIVLDEYQSLFMQALAQKSSINKTINVLEHIIGFFKKELSAQEREDLHTLVKEYKNKIIPLITVIEAVKIHVRKFDIPFLKMQKFLDPYPRELALRSSLKSGK